jgi:hypothetical protein
MNPAIKDRVNSHLETIEAVYGVKILNKNEVSGWISDRTEDEKTALTIATALNTWVMMNNDSSGVKIPYNVMNLIHKNLALK